MKYSCNIIRIKSDGTVEPDDAPIKKIDDTTYVLTDDVEVVPVDEITPSYGIIVERDGITIDGAGHTIEAREKWWGTGVNLENRKNVKIKNMGIQKFNYGIRIINSSCIEITKNKIEFNGQEGLYVHGSSGLKIIDNDVNHNAGYGIGLGSFQDSNVAENRLISNGRGIGLWSSSHNSIVGNKIECNGGHESIGVDLYNSSNNEIARNSIKNCYDGISLITSNSNEITENKIENNKTGVILWECMENRIIRNAFINNKTQVDSYGPYDNIIIQEDT